MFELGFGKLLVIGIIALIVLGPERLPKAARFAGLWVRRVRAYWFNMRAELERELAAEDLRKHVDSAKQAVHDVGAELRAPLPVITGETTPKPTNSDSGTMTPDRPHDGG
ncbi:Sec-independent protein translocase protein TatB [Solilutibacter silvestris]|uniref:Sec-independent protein translocase protein TatB n=1 Tax=Solilutibacter silvestris TaxID=1645665 RepID=A0A2K1Q0S4_9GAMM|nr:Sec-independent protein translocase protein TatB [Lysobacter silvestris]PNS08645.1 tatB: twin arginine-targeting protein translocase TatB [Lysobacter silvestris]